MRFAGILITAPVAALALAAAAAEPERSVVQILNFAQPPAWNAPWRFQAVQKSGGSGFVIKGKRIMTNAHVVSWARRIIVRRFQDPQPYVAEVEFVGHDCDLAVLKVKDERFFDGIEPLDFGHLPAVRSAVVTYGYPAGGEEISYTRGVVSRIEMQRYVHIWTRQFLTVQTDAAINPGNSGGPVVQDERVVGVAFQGNPGLQSVGFFIPAPVVDHFLKDIADGHYDGFPEAGVRMAPLQNPAYRKFLQMPDDNLGVRVDGFLPNSSAAKVLKTDDVVLRIGPFSVADDGTIIYESNRVSAALAMQFAQDGESVPLKVWRDGRLLELPMPVAVYGRDAAAGYQYDTLPRYFVFGGLVFTPLSFNYLEAQGSEPSSPANRDKYYELYFRRQEDPAQARPEPVVLALVLADAVNANFGVRGHALVDRINGRRIEKLEDAIRAFETSTNAQDIIEFLPRDGFECLAHAEAANAGTRILKTYNVPSDRRL